MVTEVEVWDNIRENPGEKLVNIIRYYTAASDTPVTRIILSTELFQRALSEVKSRTMTGAEYMAFYTGAKAEQSFTFFGIKICTDEVLDLCDVPFAVMYE